MIEPYFQLDGITIYHADCNDILPYIDPGDVDLLLTDPPYGIGYVGSDFHNMRTVTGDDTPFAPTPLLRFDRLVMWGAENYVNRLPVSRGRIVWNKRDRTSRNLPGSDVEMAWTNITHQMRLYTQVWIPHTIRGEPVLHPTQKPVGLMKWILEQWTEPGDLILDPYMGSGPIAQACFELGRRYIGVEIEEQYCQVTVERRFNQTALQLDNVT